MAYVTFTNLKDWQYDSGLKTLKHNPVSGVTVVAATDLFTSTAHGLVAGDRLIFTTTTTLPAGLALNTTYYVIASGLTANDFKVSATLAGTTIDATDTGTGTHSWSCRRLVQTLYSEVQNEFDELTQLDDTVPMKYNTPTEYELINGWTFDAAGSVAYLYGGSIHVMGTGDLWANFYTLGTIAADAVVYWDQNGSIVTTHPGYQLGHIDQLINVSPLGVDTDTRNVTVFARTWGDAYDNFQIQSPTTGGRNPVPLSTATDLNNATSSATVSAYGITITPGSPTYDFDQDGTAEAYDITIDCNGKTALQTYEYLKYITRAAETTTISGVKGQFYRYVSSAYAESKAAPFGTYAGGKFFGARGILLTNFNASDANNIILIDAAGVIRQAPTSISVAINSIVSGDRAYMARSAFASGVTVVAATDLFTSTGHGLLVGTKITFTTTTTLPAPLVAGTVYFVIASGLTANDFKISTTLSGSALDITTTGTGTHSWQAPYLPRKNQFTIASTTATTLVVNETVPNDIASTGVIRVADNRYAYTALNKATKTFTVSTNPTGEAGGANCYVPLIDKQTSSTSESVSLTYVADFAVVVFVRKYTAGAGNTILPFENVGTVTNTGLTVSAIRTSDTVAS